MDRVELESSKINIVHGGGLNTFYVLLKPCRHLIEKLVKRFLEAPIERFHVKKGEQSRGYGRGVFRGVAPVPPLNLLLYCMSRK